MKIAKLPHYLKKMYTLGARNSAKVVTNRMYNSLFEQYARYQADNKKASHDWVYIAYKHGLGTFEDFWKAQHKRSFVFSTDIYKKQLADQEALTQQADAFANNCFDILGSRDQCLMTMPWHSDFRLRYQHPDADYLFDKQLFYKDIKVSFGLTDRLIKDIKMPWELSRSSYFFVLGSAYQKGRNPLYARAFVEYITDWLDENPFLLGPNWVCPMDVGIRAFNWVWAFHFFRDAEHIDPVFWERFTSSLYDHMIYLENNWEVYDKTSNHYLADLVGYYAVTWFFADLKNVSKRAIWCHKEILKESEKQIFDEGAAYEGSTAYHQLVTEMFYHFSLLAQEHGHAIPGSFTTKLSKMFTFIDWCTTDSGYLVKIGDDDSGKMLQYGVTQELVQEMKGPKTQDKEQFFKEFGLAVYKDANWHVTLRHHAYQNRQPSGHFHNDVGSITLAVKGVPVIVDPGSYVYTPSAVWRNSFRSVTAHNTFYIEDVEPVMFDERSLFHLDLPEKCVTKTLVDNKRHTFGDLSAIALRDSGWVVEHDLYSIPASRTVSIGDAQAITIEDAWYDVSGHTFTSCWNFTLAPDITPELRDDAWHLFYNGSCLAIMHSNGLAFSVQDGWYAPGYGQKVACKRLIAKTDLTTEPVRIIFTRK